MVKLNYKEALSNNNVKEDDLLPKTLETLKTVQELEEAIKGMYEDRRDASQSDMAAINDQITNAEGTLARLDDALCKKIAKNEFYKTQAVKLQHGREAKKNNAIATTVIKPKVAPIVAASEVKNNGGEIPLEVNEENKDELKEEKKGLGVGEILLGVGLLVVTGFAYNHFKNRS